MQPERNFKPEPRVLVRSKRTPMYFGVKWDMESPQILNAILQDVMSYARVVPTLCRLVVVCQDFGFLDKVGSMAGVEVTSDPDTAKQCQVWKLYYVHECPDVPQQGKHVYSKRVNGEEKGDKIKMSQGQPGYPSLYNPSDNIVVPPGRSPNINKIPPRYSSQTNQPGFPVQW
jgi:hypothetical protein